MFRFAELGNADDYPSPLESSSSTEMLLPFTADPEAQFINDDISTFPNIYRDKYERKPKIRRSEESRVRREVVTAEIRQLVQEKFGR
jgi:hypothetical protein